MWLSIRWFLSFSSLKFHDLIVSVLCSSKWVQSLKYGASLICPVNSSMFCVRDEGDYRKNNQVFKEL